MANCFLKVFQTLKLFRYLSESGVWAGFITIAVCATPDCKLVTQTEIPCLLASRNPYKAIRQ